LSEENGVESFRMKLLRMFVPIRPQKSDAGQKPDPDIEIMDPFERMENSIRRDNESKRENLERKSRS
jgi:hypothetical protein